MENYTKLTGKYLIKHKARTILTLIGISIAIAMFVIIGNIYYSGIDNQVESIKKESGDFEAVFQKLTSNKVGQLKNNAEIKNGGVSWEIGLLNIQNINMTDSLKNVNIRAYDSAAIKDIFNIKLTEGRLPKDDSEIIVDKKFYAVLKDKGFGEKIKGMLKSSSVTENKEYTIVGAYDSQEIKNCAISYIDSDKLGSNGDGNYNYFFNLKSDKGIIKAVDKIAKANNITKYGTNTKLLYLYGQGPDTQKNDGLETIFAIIAAFVVICTAVVIYNSFNISVMERIKHYGILRSIGATKAQIRRLVFKEATIMSALSIPMGVLIGLAGMYVTFNFLMDGFLMNFQITFHWNVIAISALLGIFTVFVSAFFPARTASKVSPIEAIRGTTVVKNDRVSRRGGFLAKLIFRFEGQVAYKNIKRSRKRFYVTCMSLMLSMIMFIFFSNFVDILLTTNKTVNQNIKVDAMFQKGDKLESPYMTNEFGDKLQKMDGISEVFKLNYYEGILPLSKKMLNEKFAYSLSETKNQQYEDWYFIKKAALFSYDEAALSLFNKENKTKIDYTEFCKNNQVIIINKSSGFDKNKKSFYDQFTKYKAGDKLELPLLNKSFINKPTAEELQKLIKSDGKIKLDIIKVVDLDTFSGIACEQGYEIIVSPDTFKRITAIDGYDTVAINYKSKEARDKLYEKLNIVADENKVSFYDISTQRKQMDDVVNQLMILTYGFIGLIILIATVNIINTVTINLLVKKREYAIFKAIGMTKGQFKKLILLEGSLFGMVSSIIGLPIAYALSYAVIFNNPMGMIGYKMAAWPYIMGALGIILITLLAAMFPLRKLNDMNIVEALRLEE